jgi:hypothetical protein
MEWALGTRAAAFSYFDKEENDRCSSDAVHIVDVV